LDVLLVLLEPSNPQYTVSQKCCGFAEGSLVDRQAGIRMRRGGVIPKKGPD
jgi:hypothetical protein